MSREELLRALRRLAVETGSLACLGCGYEHNCSLHGCAVIREAAEALEASGDEAAPTLSRPKAGQREDAHGA